MKSLPGTTDEQRGIVKGGGTWAFERECEEEHEDHDSSLCLVITMEGMNSIDIRWSWIWNCVIYVITQLNKWPIDNLGSNKLQCKVKMEGGGGWNSWTRVIMVIESTPAFQECPTLITLAF